MKTKGVKVIASLIVLVLMFTYFSIVQEAVAIVTNEVLLNNEIANNVISQNNAVENTNTVPGMQIERNNGSRTENQNVDFDVYFARTGENMYSSTKQIGGENYLYAKVVAKEGYVKSSSITFDNPNFKITGVDNSGYVSSFTDNSLVLSQITSNTEVEIQISIEALSGDRIAVDGMYKVNTANFTSAYVDKNGKEKTVEGTATVGLVWDAERVAEFDVNVENVIPYISENSNKNLVLQFLAKAKLVGNTLPLDKEKIEIELPLIDNKKASEIVVSAKSIKQINGEEDSSFSSDNYVYDAEQNKLTIEVSNKQDQEGKIAWNKNVEDEYIITAVYDATNVNIENENYSFTCKGTAIFDIANKTHASKTLEKNLVISKDNKKSIVDYEVRVNTPVLSKGQIYANYNRTQKFETDYDEVIVANVTFSQMVEKIELNQEVDNFVNDTLAGPTSYRGTNYTYFKLLSISKANFDKILGEEGKVSIYSGETLLAEIDKNIEVNSANNYEVNLASYNVNELSIKTTKPVSEGRLYFNISKAICGEVGYSLNQMRDFTGIQIDVTANTTYKNITTGESISKTGTIQFTEPETRADISVSNTDFSTVVENKDVKINATLRTDSLSYRLYKDPTLRIILPSYFETINVKESNIYFETEGTKLDVTSSNLIQNADGTKVIEIVLAGTQTEYTLGSVSKGLNIELKADITLNKLTANKQDNIVMVYTNNYIEAEEKTAVAPINVVAPVGVVTVSTISDYADNAQDVTTISEDNSAVLVNTGAPERIATLQMNVINNYNNTIDNVTILGRTMIEGNTNIANGENLGSNTNMPLSSGISATGTNSNDVSVYYSENGSATQDLNNTENGWTQTPSNLSNVRSYLILANNQQMNTGDSLNFNYNVAIPGNMNYNQTATQQYAVFFNNNLSTGTIPDRQISTTLGATTGTGPVLEASLGTSVATDAELQEGDIISATLTVTNSGTEVANNVKATVNVPAGLGLVAENGDGEFEGIENLINIGDITAGSTKSINIYFKVGNISEDRKRVELTVNVTADRIEEGVNTENISFTLLKKYFNVNTRIITNTYNELNEQDEYQYSFSINAKGFNQVVENTTLEIDIPEELEYITSSVAKLNDLTEEDITSTSQINYNRNTRKLSINIGKVESWNNKIVYVNVKINNLKSNVYDEEIKLTANIFGDNVRSQKITTEEVKVGKPGYAITQTCSIPAGGTITADEDFTYVYTVENLSNMAIAGIRITDILPKELTYLGATIKYGDGTTTKSTAKNDSGNPEFKIKVDGKARIVIEIKVKAKALNETSKVSNVLKVSYEDEVYAESTPITHTILKYEKSSGGGENDNPSEPDDDNDLTKRIMGAVWLDENKDGIKDENEKRLKDVQVYLFNDRTGQIVTDASGKAISKKTSDSGVYSFTNVPKGSYTVIFMYDTKTYSATAYKKQGVDETVNSDAMDKNITIGNETKLGAITEQLLVADSNLYNIDLGLVENAKFDLSLNKVVSKITVQDDEGTETTDYGNTKLAKKDLVSKKINNTTIVVEYKIQVKNEGAISGYAKKIVDYVPQEMKFSTELNPDWYVSNNREILNSSLANTLINPGETKEITLILTKKMSSESLGLINNTAEIYESYNDLGIADYDSQVANKVADEDDISGADILITVKTGETIIFIGLSIGIIAVISLSAIIIKKKVLR